MPVLSNFTPGASVSLYRPTATPGVPLPAPIQTVVADANGKATFTDPSPTVFGHYLAISGGRRVWFVDSPAGQSGGDPQGFIPPIWSSVS